MWFPPLINQGIIDYSKKILFYSNYNEKLLEVLKTGEGNNLIYVFLKKLSRYSVIMDSHGVRVLISIALY